MVEVTVKELTHRFEEKIEELQEEPEFQWRSDKVKHSVDENGKPCVKLAIGNVPLEYDLWQGLRNPALVGFYPANLQEIWEFYANRKMERIDEYGRQTIFQVPRSFNHARKNCRRAAIVSIMLPFSHEVIGDYAQLILKRRKGSSYLYSRMFEDVNLMIDKAVSRVAIDLVTNDNVVIAMNDKNVKGVSEESIPLTHQGASHGPTKGGNYPQKSIAALTGLGQFGISRIIFRDELVEGKVQRFVGPLKSIIMFDIDRSIDGDFL